MKSKIFLIMICLSTLLFPQTAWVDSGAVYNSLEMREISFEGVISGVDTLDSLPFDLSGHEAIYSIWSEAWQDNDSVKLQYKRESAGLPDVWLDSKLIYQDISGNAVFKADTLTNIASVRRLKIVGVSGNGVNTGFKIKIIAKNR